MTSQLWRDDVYSDIQLVRHCFNSRPYSLAVQEIEALRVEYKFLLCQLHKQYDEREEQNSIFWY